MRGLYVDEDKGFEANCLDKIRSEGRSITGNF